VIFKPLASLISPPARGGGRRIGRATTGEGAGSRLRHRHQQHHMARHGWDVSGIDFVPRAVTIAKRKPPRHKPHRD
jgi:hypothetical protein